MLDINDLWIGDKLRLKKSGRIGTFDGIINGKVRIKLAKKTVLSSPANLELHSEPETNIELNIFESLEPSKKRPEPSIDLHIEVLNPSLLNGKPERILDYQIQAAKQFIEQAIDHNFLEITIIHGKGEGVLRSEIRHLLSLYDEVLQSLDVNKMGGTQVLFMRYD